MITNKKITIEIRDWISSDYDTYIYWHDGHYKWKEFNGPYYPEKKLSKIKEEIHLLKQTKSSNSNSIKNRMVIANKENNILIGTVSWYWQSKETHWMSIGIALYDDKFWGYGLGYEALKQWIDLLFKSFPEIVRLDLRTWSGNHGMIKLAEKLGFQLEARFRKARIVNDKYYDSLGYGILREEWFQ